MIDYNYEDNGSLGDRPVNDINNHKMHNRG